MKIPVSFLIAVVVHVVFLFAGNAIYKPAEVYFQHGESAIQIKLISSIQSHERKETSAAKRTMEDDIAEEAVKLQNPDSPSEPLKNDSAIKSVLMPDQESVIDSAMNETYQSKDESKTSDRQTSSDKSAKQNTNIVKENDQYKIARQVKDGDAESDSAPSTEIIADLMEKGITALAVTGVEKPEYPLSCRRKGHEGVAILESTIDKDGKCIDINVVKTAGCSELDESAMNALKKARYTPAKSFGVNIRSTKRIAFRFTIKDID